MKLCGVDQLWDEDFRDRWDVLREEWRMDME